ncbi:NADH:ubiquinone oxidoreductase [Pseudomonas sp. N040]|uniref:NADH:ubiquinone oxidoreductase n=1 Tax=Pseudomonas sp. N040 TaxID=2785325 RepID=UPI0018A318C7|nr:NADH:ubiquinone oxidoreductase [Pseudomonas sp. N040]MBF7728899.1 NADH:ubiquinone oxidoreductase [Pseudomonas sp. N040]MBW7012539.1 NADH:ubiquinone oxidoreductase [Pseudomonas sp. N040]
MRSLLIGLLALLPALVQAEACVVRSRGSQVEVQVCQQNVSIPQQMFHDGFCQPQLKGQTVEVSYVEQCPAGAYGACRNAMVSQLPYRQDIHYYGVASDARILQRACEQQYKGSWTAF